jgi:hypothetical protein
MTQKQKIAMLFLRKGTVTMNELNRIGYRYGNLIHELRKDGWVIISQCKSRSYWEYVLANKPNKNQLKLLNLCTK